MTREFAYPFTSGSELYPTCEGCRHGSTYIGWGGSARYYAKATPIACLLTDRDLPEWRRPLSQGITRRRWRGPDAVGRDDAGQWLP